MKKKALIFLISIGLGATVAWASTIHTFANGETLTAANLNAVLQHLHASVGHGHGGVIVDADVSPSAAIASSKLAGAALIPKAWGSFVTLCGVGVCTETLDISTGITSITHTAVGKWLVTWSTTRADSKYVVLVTPVNDATAVARSCTVVAWGTTTASVWCFTNTTSALFDVNFNVLMFDNL